MRVIERKMLDAIRTGKSWALDNTRVDIFSNRVNVYLHNNLICEIVPDETLTVWHRGWDTPTTKSRLNAILNAYNLPTISQRNYTWYIGKDGDDSLFYADRQFNI